MRPRAECKNIYPLIFRERERELNRNMAENYVTAETLKNTTSLVDNALRPDWVRQLEDVNLNDVDPMAEFATKLAGKVSELKRVKPDEKITHQQMALIVAKDESINLTGFMRVGETRLNGASYMLGTLELNVGTCLQGMALVVDKERPEWGEIMKLSRTARDTSDIGLDIVLAADLLPNCFCDNSSYEETMKAYRIPPSRITDVLVDNAIRIGSGYLGRK